MVPPTVEGSGSRGDGQRVRREGVIAAPSLQEEERG